MTVKKYKSGLTVIVHEERGLRSVSAGIMVGTGSAYETPENNGISHFIEHMQYKGTDKRSAEDIVRDFDRAGAMYNAFTAKEYTCFYFKSIDEKTEDCFDVLSDLFLHSRYDQKELDLERKVILEEIGMSKDEADGVCYDLFMRTAYTGSLGMEILGTEENVSRFNKEDILAYRAARYLPSDTVVGFVGNISEKTAFSLVEKYLSPMVDAPYTAAPGLVKQEFSGGYAEYVHDFQQSEITVGYPAPSLDTDRRVAMSALDVIMGGGMGSRLFQRLREKMALCYSVGTLSSMGSKNGSFAVCANVNVQNAGKCVAAMNDEIQKLAAGGVTADELERARMQLKVNAMFGKEDPMRYMLSLMRRRTLIGTDYDLDATIAEIERVTVDDVNALAREILAARPVIAYAGPALAEPLDKKFYQKGEI